jgi:hypothetical protein
LDIVDIDVPIHYGEGLFGASPRLQFEILEKKPDRSIFAWENIDASEDTRTGLLAPSLAYFTNSKFTLQGNIV